MVAAMIELLRPYRKRLALILLVLMAEMAFNAMVPLSLRFLIDDGLTPHNYKAMLQIVIALSVGVLVVSAAAFWRP